MSIFSSLDFGMLQTMLFPVIAATTGVDLQDLISGKSAAFRTTGEAFSDIAAIFDMAAEAMDDGILTNDEINALIAASVDLPAAFSAIASAIDTAESPMN